MKKYTLVIALGIFLGMTILAHASDIVQSEVIPDVVKWELDTVKFMPITETAIVDYRKVDSGGEATGKMVRVVFTNTEEANEFNQLITLINNEINIKGSITKAVKIKLGIS